MPPITSSRPGARATTGASRPEKSGRARCASWLHTRATWLSNCTRSVVMSISRFARRSALWLERGADETAAVQGRGQRRLDAGSDLVVGVTDPGHIRLQVERDVERAAPRVREPHSGLG